MRLHSRHGYDIVCDAWSLERAETVIVAMHGFAGDRKSSCIAALAERMTGPGVGLIDFDWPAHGDSPVDGQALRIQNCLDDLDTVCAYARQAGNAPVLYGFATSFGGYIAMLYHHAHPEVFSRLVLRSPALQMPRLLPGLLAQAQRTPAGWITGFERELLVTEEMAADLQANRLDELYPPGAIPGDILVIHGDADDVVPLAASIAFCRAHGLPLAQVPGADHRYKKPGELEQVIDLAADFLGENK
ncbi:MAG: alpha/beta hydrolase [Oscillospiraceae bacterium]|nr:alpha/beta hydrolase [Oscillospiraceae bacterium]